ncbi:MAG: NAD(P)H-dependent flavin oxidoreductase [Acidimicrobiales bacterium]
MKTRITEMLGIEIPIVQAPMGWIARSPLASAVSNAGGLGIIETSSGDLETIKGEITAMRDLTDKPFGVNLAQMFIRDLPGMVEFVVENEISFVTTSAGDPSVLVPQLKELGITVFHVVPTVRGAEKAIDAGVDGLVVEGAEGGGFKNADGASSLVLVPEIAGRFDVPIIAAGGIVDGPSMAAAFAMGADAVQMGTRMVASAESPIHDNWKQSIVDGRETDTVMVNRHHRPAMRVLATQRATALDTANEPASLDIEAMMGTYFGGDMESGFAMSGQVQGRIHAVEPVADVLRRTWDDCQSILRTLGTAAADDSISK